MSAFTLWVEQITPYCTDHRFPIENGYDYEMIGIIRMNKRKFYPNYGMFSKFMIAFRREVPYGGNNKITISFLTGNANDGFLRNQKDYFPS